MSASYVVKLGIPSIGLTVCGIGAVVTTEMSASFGQFDLSAGFQMCVSLSQ